MRRPGVPVTVWLLSVVVGSGLIALFLAARAAFGTVAGDVQAVAAALLIEAGTIVEAVSFARSRNRVAGVGLVVSFVVSMTYNITQAGDARPDLVWWQLAALGLGPLAALTFVSLALGEELRIYRVTVDEWREGLEHERRLAVRRKERREWKLVSAAPGLLADRSMAGRDEAVGALVGRWGDKADFLSDDDVPEWVDARTLADVTGQSVRNARRWLEEKREVGHVVGNAG